MINHNYIRRKGILFKYWWLSVVTVIFIFSTIVYQTNAFKLSSYTKATVWILKGTKAYKNNYWGDAGILYQRALTIYPKNTQLKYNLANAYYQQGRYKEAVQLYGQLLNDKSNTIKAAAWNNLGNAYYRQNLLFQSFDAYKNAILLNDGDETARQNFLFVVARLQQLIRANNSKKKKRDDKNAGEGKTKDSKPDDDKDGQKSADEQSLGPYQVSDKEMNNLLKISKEQERVPLGSKSSGKQASRVYTNGPDY